MKTPSSTIREFVEALSHPDTWPHVEVLLRKATGVIYDEWQSTPQPENGVKIDTKSLIKDLSSSSLNVELQNFFIWNHRFVAMLMEKNRRAAVETYDFVDSEMPHAMFNANQMAVISSKCNDIIKLQGHILDLGVYKGGSTRALARIFPSHVIHGFDSFEGLPEDWAHVLKGDFGDIKGMLPDMPSNVRLYKGWFDDTLPIWYETNKTKPISLLRIDCDIYSSTKTIFRVLAPIITSGTWIVFDELIGYRGWKDHEYKAFMEFRTDTGLEFEYVAFGLTYVIGYVK